MKIDTLNINFQEKLNKNLSINLDSTFLLIDLKHPMHGWANRDMTGGFGSGQMITKPFLKYLKILKVHL